MMASETFPELLEHALPPLLTLAVLAALFLPLFGPLLDHHFTERQPVHAHIYLDGTAREHLHSYETYEHHWLQPRSGAYGVSRLTENVVVLNDSHGVGLGPTGTPAYLHQVARLVFEPAGEPDRFALSHDNAFPMDATIPTPKKPPRA